MPLAKKFSRIFKSNDAANLIARMEPSVAIFEEDDEEDISAVTQASLEDEVTRLERCVEDQKLRLSRQGQAASQTEQHVNYLESLLASRVREINSQEARADQAERRLQELHNTHSNDLSALSVRLRDVSEDHSRLREERTQLKNENETLQNDIRALYGLNQQYEAWAPRAKAIQTEREEEIQDLEQRLTLALQPMDEDSRRAYDESVQWSSQKKALEATFETEKTSMNLCIANLENMSRNRDEQYDKERSTWESRVAALEAALEDEKSGHRDAKTFIQALEVHQESLRADVDDAQSKVEQTNSTLEVTQSALDQARSTLNHTQSTLDRTQSALEETQSTLEEALSSFEETQSLPSTQLSKLIALFGPDPTPRQFLFVKLFLRRFARVQSNQVACSQFTQGYKAEDLTAIDLDTPLPETSLATFVDSISPDSRGHHVLQRLQFKRCPGCCRHKVNGSPNESNRNLIEYPHSFRQNKCRTCTLCSNCLKQKLKNTIKVGWWHELDSPLWLNCPEDGCQTPLLIGSIEAFVEMLRDFTDEDIDMFRGMYRRALALRAALLRVEPRPGPDAISMSISLHQRLLAFGFLSNKFNVGDPTYENAAEPFEAGDVLMGSIERENLRIPIFTKFFRRSETAKDCSICLESYNEVDIRSKERWTQACEGFHGAWMSELSSFPTRDALQCDHDMSVCKDCIRRHLESQLEQHGRNASGRLTCLICNRVLSEQEIRCLGSAETVRT